MAGPGEYQAYLSLGGNIGNPRRTMAAALRLIDANDLTRVVATSALYRTPPWGELRQPHFLNASAEIWTELHPYALLRLCLATEEKLMRIRTERFGPRSIDIDILTYGDLFVRQSGLEIPHPRMLERAFVMAPLLEIAPELSVRGVRLADRLAMTDQIGIVRETDDGGWWQEN